MSAELIKQLKQIPLFSRLGREDIKAVVKQVKRKQYEAGDEVCRQAQTGHSLYIVESGELRVLHVDTQGISQEVGSLEPGDYFGETSLLLGEPRDATIEAVQSTTLLSIHSTDFEPLLKERPAMLKALQMRSDVAHKYRSRAAQFKWLDPDEVVIITNHRHDVLLLRSLITPLFTLLVILVICIYWAWTSKTMIPVIVGVALVAVMLVFILYLCIDHWDDIYIVTNKRVARRSRTPLGQESRIDAPLRTIQDIQESQVGLLAQMYNFGDLIIETAGERGHVAFRELPDPSGTREIIFEQIRRLQSGAKVAERDAIRTDMRRYFELQGRGEKASAPAKAPPRQRFELTWSDLLPWHIARYFLPPLRHEQGDTITWRKHWVALLKPIAPPTLLGFAATVIAGFLLVRVHAEATAIMIGYGLVLVTLLPWWLWQFDDWQNDIYQVTSTRIIDVERLPFFLREDRREASLGMIQNIKFEIPGTLAKVLNYGSVTIETAGAGAFTFDRVKNPSGVQADIFRRMDAFRKRQDQAAAERHRTELLDWFSVYEQVRRTPPPSQQ